MKRPVGMVGKKNKRLLGAGLKNVWLHFINNESWFIVPRIMKLPVVRYSPVGAVLDT